METSKPSVTIIGRGALGSTLEKFFSQNGYPVRSVWNSRGGSVAPESNMVASESSNNLPENDTETGRWVFITTPDDLISEIAELLAQTSISWRGRTVIHCSGNLTSDELNPLSDKGAGIVSMHPIQTFKKGDVSGRFENITISLEGDSKEKERLKPLIEEMGAKHLLLDKKQKRYLHIAAVMASNYLVALMFSTENLLREVNISDGFGSLEKLVEQTVANIFQQGPENALTGPISRGDIQSVKTHLDELKGLEQEYLYKLLGLQALKITERSGSLTTLQSEKLRDLLGTAR